MILKNPSNQEGYVGLTPNYPAKVVPIKFGVNVKSGSALIAQGGSYMTHIGDVGKFVWLLNVSVCFAIEFLTAQYTSPADRCWL